MHTNQKTKTITLLFLLLILLEGLITCYSLLSIPADPKNAFLFGYSKSRLLVLGISFLMLLGSLLLFVIKHLRVRLERWFVSPRLSLKWVFIVGGFFTALLWVTIWLPAARLGEWGETYRRLRPLLIWIELIMVQLFIGVLTARDRIQFAAVQSLLHQNKRSVLYLCGGLILAILFFFILKVVSPDEYGSQLFFPQGAPLSSLQVFLAWIVFLILFVWGRLKRDQGKERKWIPLLIFIVIWAATFFAWNSVQFPCTDDRLGPFPPNNVCYPDIDDAVFSIGSHYITLGEGINNHWMTDKPLYMVFLAVAQWIAGPAIDRYLSIQVAVLALIPAGLFLFGRKLAGTSFGLFTSFLSSIGGVYSILLYRQIGSVNVRYENSEVFVSFLMVLLALAVFRWLRNPIDKKWGLISGGVLGLSVLVRFTPIMIAPLLVLAVLWMARRSLRSVIPALVYFVIAAGLVITPWIISANDVNGNNFYYQKIQQVIQQRFEQQPDASQNDSLTDVTDVPVNGIPASDDSVLIQSEAQVPDSESPQLNSASLIVYHFFNNVYSSLAKLPTTFTFESLEDQVESPLWSFDKPKPIWNVSLSIENGLALLLDLILVLTGLLVAWKRFGAAAFSGLLVQLGYYLGNAVALTSGGRYLESVHPIVLVYYGLGIYGVTAVIYRFLGGRPDTVRQESAEVTAVTSDKPVSRRKLAWYPAVLVLPFLVIGLSLPLANSIKSRMPEESGLSVQTLASSILEEQVSSEQWQKFLDDPQKLVVQGTAYHPNYFRSAKYDQGNLSFELLVFGKDHLFVSHSQNIIPTDTFGDGSSVILIGCQTGKDHMWAADRILMKTYIILQLDHEGSQYIDPDFQWSCGAGSS